MTAAPAAAIGRVATIGPHILDVLGRPVDAIPPGQGSARLAEIRATAAGTAAGVAVDLAKLGAAVTSFGAIGTDLLGDILLAALSSHGVSTRGVVRKPGAQTSATILPIRSSGERPALHVPGVSPLLQRDDIDLRPGAHDAVLLGGPDALPGLSKADLTALVTAAKAGGALVAIDVLHPGSERDLARIGPALAAADWFWPNEDQLRALTGRADLDRAIADVLALGTGGVAVTLGAQGCVLTGADGELSHVPAISVPVVDTTGCGDAFNAGMLAGLLLGCERADAAWLGVACGALVATGLGSDAGIRDFGQVAGFLRAANAEVADRVAARQAAKSGQRSQGGRQGREMQWHES